MRKAEIVAEIAEKVNLSKKDIKEVIETFFLEIGHSLAKGDRVDLRGFGVFKPILRKEKMGRNPKTGEIITVPKKMAVVFKPGKELKNKVEDRGV
ncbi:integration host factor subunit beta [bacterium]|nr:integration host factor subunit beta [bacterium]MBU1599639.1 integration host factor subunit beta [bacterium]MBU2461842.1 integration host factor subunit beta [bacterium]